jgi:hypothetical protein
LPDPPPVRLPERSRLRIEEEQRRRSDR